MSQIFLGKSKKFVLRDSKRKQIVNWEKNLNLDILKRKIRNNLRNLKKLNENFISEIWKRKRFLGKDMRKKCINIFVKYLKTELILKKVLVNFENNFKINNLTMLNIEIKVIKKIGKESWKYAEESSIC